VARFMIEDSSLIFPSRISVKNCSSSGRSVLKCIMSASLNGRPIESEPCRPSRKKCRRAGWTCAHGHFEGTSLGPYRIESKIAEGGMGIPAIISAAYATHYPIPARADNLENRQCGSLPRAHARCALLLTGLRVSASLRNPRRTRACA